MDIPASTSISFRTAPMIVEWHNRREKYVQFESHIDPNGVHEIWLDNDIKLVYEELFDDSIKEYNKKQKRADRKIKNYYSDVCDDTRGHVNKELEKMVIDLKNKGKPFDHIKVKGKHPGYEVIAALGSSEYDRDEDGKKIYSGGENSQPLQSKLIDPELGKMILMDFVAGWPERNPNLKLYGVYYHADEDGVPHIHCDFVPFADGFTRGPSRQSSINKALEAQGFVYTKEMQDERAEYKKNHPDEHVPQINPYTLWQESERKALEEICHEYGIEKITHPTIEKQKKVVHESSADYREKMKLKDEISDLNFDLQENLEMNEYLMKQNKELDKKIEEKQEMLEKSDTIEKQFVAALDIEHQRNIIANALASKQKSDAFEFMKSRKNKAGESMYDFYIAWQSEKIKAELERSVKPLQSEAKKIEPVPAVRVDSTNRNRGVGVDAPPLFTLGGGGKPPKPPEMGE